MAQDRLARGLGRTSAVGSLQSNLAEEADVRGACHALLSSRGEASGVALASALIDAYRTLSRAQRLAFFEMMRDDFGADRTRLCEAALSYIATGNAEAARALLEAAEPRRQELLRRLNLAPGNTAHLVRMREDLLDACRTRPDLRDLDLDFVHLFASWFNRGFLRMDRLNWTSSADVLERIIRYEQVHKMEGWDDLKRRVCPIDRRCYAFFHPALEGEPLIFVEVALMSEIPSAIAPLLGKDRPLVPPDAQTTAVFYSISTTQRGLTGVSFGHFLIKQVAHDLKRDVPALDSFVTLSPVPGFAAWLAGERRNPASAFLTESDRAVLEGLDDPGWARMVDKAGRLAHVLMPLAAAYFLYAKNAAGRPLDPVARFHLGNGARLERVNWLADMSDNGLRQSHGMMVNYLYALPEIEAHHEAYTNDGIIAASPAVHALPKREFVPPVRAHAPASD